MTASPETSTNRVRIFDTTLRDGEQSPGASMSTATKLKMAAALRDLRVDVIEAGFPIASPGDFEAVQLIARRIDGPVVAALARCQDEDIDRAWEAVREAARPRLHVFLATSAIHREHKLRLRPRQVVERAAEAVARARQLCEDVEFSPEDASRTEPDFLVEVLEAVLDAGASTLNIPDTVGYAVPEEFGALVARLRTQVRGIDEAVVSVHCHDDLGLAVANSLAAVRAGARQVECTVNGIGERAGNCSLEEVVMALRTRADSYGGLETGVDTPRLLAASKLLTSLTGLEVQRNKAIVGRNAFAHEAGIHQHGMLCHESTYEIMRPEEVGVDGTSLVLGKHSGRHALQRRMKALGHDLGPEELAELFEAFKRLADRKKVIWDEDLLSLAEGRLRQPGPWRIVGFQTVSGSSVPHVAEVRLEHEETGLRQEAACGDGPVDALFRAIRRATGVELELDAYHVRSVTRGEDAQGEVVVEASHGDRPLRARAASTDIIEASAQAYLEVVNRLAAGRPAADAGGRKRVAVAATARPAAEADAR